MRGNVGLRFEETWITRVKSVVIRNSLCHTAKHLTFIKPAIQAPQGCTDLDVGSQWKSHLKSKQLKYSVIAECRAINSNPQFKLPLRIFIQQILNCIQINQIRIFCVSDCRLNDTKLLPSSTQSEVAPKKYTNKPTGTNGPYWWEIENGAYVYQIQSPR